MRILSNLAESKLHVSELARRVQMSRPLLYMHLTKLEEAGYVSGNLELGEDGKALKYFHILPFEIRVTLDVIEAAVAEDPISD
jgi:DNA-binding transcriptional ArsR family regulator